jgi:hypothetical protein
VRIQTILQSLETAIDGDSPASEIARILVPAKAGLLAEIAQEWYSEHVLPLLATPATARSSEQSWDGYLVWGSWTQAMLPGLIPAYMHHLPEIMGTSNDAYDLSDLNQVHTMASQLIDLDPTEPALRALCEQLGTLGSPQALEFQGRIQ